LVCHVYTQTFSAKTPSSVSLLYNTWVGVLTFLRVEPRYQTVLQMYTCVGGFGIFMR